MTTAEVILRFEEVTQLDPGVQWDWVELVWLYRSAGRFGDAKDAARHAAETAKTEWDQSVASYELGNVQVAEGNSAGALASYRKVLSLAESWAARDPNNAEWQRDLIVSLVKTGTVKANKAYFKRALDIAASLLKSGKLGPADAWMIDTLKQVASQ